MITKTKPVVQLVNKNGEPSFILPCGRIIEITGDLIRDMKVVPGPNLTNASQNLNLNPSAALAALGYKAVEVLLPVKFESVVVDK